MSVETIFAAAAQKSSAEREEFLKEACGTDADLRRKVERLLKAHDAAAEFLESPADRPVGTVDYAPISEKPGSMVGPYKLKEQIGEGGFGLVFVAEQQEPVKRKVALKVIKPGMDTREVMARFTAERQALALMDHPNIARVLDAGATDSGRPYFVMELVRGIPITDYCDQNQLSPRDRLDLFITVCQAVQHAHQKGIIHRDIKPSNVLVTSHDGKPVAKVIDFGVAKAINQQLTERSVYTNFAQMVGTPLYMSPEQAEMSGLDIDTRSDIYSLGVLLYELLTGTTPLDKKRFAKAAYDEIRRMIREDEPQKPSTRLSTSDSILSIAAQRHIEPAKLSKLMRGDLDWITMKALEKDRTRRYETASGLARDIQRYLSDEPVEACPPSAGYRLRKFASKHRTGIANAAAAFTMLIMFTLLSIYFAIVSMNAEFAAKREADLANHERGRATAAAEESEKARARAQESEQRATAAAEAEKKARENAQTREAETKAVLEFVENKVFAAARPMDQEGGQGYEVKLAHAITAALPYVEKSFIDQPLIEARLRLTLGKSFLFLGKADVAEQQYRRARDLFNAKLGPDRADTLKSMSGLATSYETLGRFPEALKLREETFELQKLLLGPDHPETLGSMNNLALSYGELGRDQEGLALLEDTLKLKKAKLGPEHPATLMTMNNLALCYGKLGRHQEALALFEETLKLKTEKLGPDHPDTLGNMNNVATTYVALGRHAEALALREETFKRQKAKLGPDHPDTLMSMSNLALSYATLGRLPEALTLYEEALKLRKAKLGLDHPDTLMSMSNLGTGYAAVGRLPEALALHEETLKLRRAKLGATHPNTAGTIYDIACVHAVMIAKAEDRAKQSDTAMDWLRQAVAAGFKNVAHMKKDTDLDPLRDREDFKNLIAELEAKLAADKAGEKK